MLLLIPVIVLGLFLFVEIAYSTLSFGKIVSIKEERVKADIMERLKEEITTVHTVTSKAYNEVLIIDSSRKEEFVVSILESFNLPTIGYVFSADYEGNVKLGPGKGTNVIDVKDVNGFMVVRELIMKANQGGGFVEYVMPPVDGSKEVPKISYVLPLKELGWYIGGGIDFDVLEDIKATEVKDLTDKMVSNTVKISLVLIFSTIIAYFMAKASFSKLDFQTRALMKSLEKSSKDRDYRINEAQYDIEELSVIVSGINNLLETRSLAEVQRAGFIAKLSHEIRTPLNAIIGFGDLLSKHEVKIDEAKVYIKLINVSSRKLLNTINDVIEMSRIEAGLLVTKKHRVNLYELLDQYKDYYTKVCEDKGLKFRLFSFGVKKKNDVIIDKAMLDGIINNLISNSVKYTEKGLVRLRIVCDDNELKIFVSDTGIGIPDAYKDEIFRYFVRVDSELSVSKGGSGIGLSIVKSYVDALGGTIYVESEIGKGSTFTVNLPITIEQNTSSSP